MDRTLARLFRTIRRSEPRFRPLFRSLPDEAKETLITDLYLILYPFMERTPALRIHALRHRNGLSQTQLAPLLGMSQGDVSNLENGRRVVTPEIARRYARFFGVREKLILGLEWEAPVPLRRR